MKLMLSLFRTALLSILISCSGGKSGPEADAGNVVAEQNRNSVSAQAFISSINAALTNEGFDSSAVAEIGREISSKTLLGQGFLGRGAVAFTQETQLAVKIASDYVEQLNKFAAADRIDSALLAINDGVVEVLASTNTAPASFQEHFTELAQQAGASNEFLSAVAQTPAERLAQRASQPSAQNQPQNSPPQPPAPVSNVAANFPVCLPGTEPVSGGGCQPCSTIQFSTAGGSCQACPSNQVQSPGGASCYDPSTQQIPGTGTMSHSNAGGVMTVMPVASALLQPFGFLVLGYEAPGLVMAANIAGPVGVAGGVVLAVAIGYINYLDSIANANKREYLTDVGNLRMRLCIKGHILEAGIPNSDGQFPNTEQGRVDAVYHASSCAAHVVSWLSTESRRYDEDLYNGNQCLWGTWFCHP